MLIQRLAHTCDMGGRGSTATANDARTGINGKFGVSGHDINGPAVNNLAVDVFRHAAICFHDNHGINTLLIREALAGHDVVRLKGGDPLIFGRGGEEAEDARAAGVPVEIVPGISAANGAAAAAQIALTHRDAASIVSFVAGQCKGLSDQGDYFYFRCPIGSSAPQTFINHSSTYN